MRIINKINNDSNETERKVNHLNIICDTQIGSGVNIGAGTITCNYDGVHKHQTEIADDVYVGSYTALVAPVTLGKASTIAAGSIVTRDMAEGGLAIARAQQRKIQAWERLPKT